MNESAARLESIDGYPVPLRKVTAEGRLTGLVFDLSVTQTWENDSTTNIEGVYTFPLPHHAVLLGLELQIGDRHLEARAVARGEAAKEYEEAIDAGNTAVLLEHSDDGIYTVSLGNLQAGEHAVIRYRYAQLLDRTSDAVRLSVPTVIAPRYGDAGRAGLAPHAVPATDLAAAYPFELKISIVGELANADLASPTHPVDIERGSESTDVVLKPGAWLDRDFVLLVSGVETAAASTLYRDGDEWVALVSLDPGLPAAAERPLHLKLVVDCSGSMGGDSIAQARRALANVFRRLNVTDQVSLTRFGSSFEHLLPDTPVMFSSNWWKRRSGQNRLPASEPRMLPATESNIAWWAHRVSEMQADLGGTEMGAALKAAMEIPILDESVRDILLITDGEIWAIEQVAKLAAESGHRLFVVAVGAAPAESLARQLADQTGGACEFVSPREDVEAAVVRMFKRLRETPRTIESLLWPATPLWQAPYSAAVFGGDTVHMIAGFAEQPSGDVTLKLHGEDHVQCNQITSVLTGRVTAGDAVPRLAAFRRLVGMEDEAATELAERYQLATRFTSLVVVDQREEVEKAKELPELRQVSQMLAAGWGAVGSFDLCEQSMPCVNEVGSKAKKSMAFFQYSRDAEINFDDLDLDLDLETIELDITEDESCRNLSLISKEITTDPRSLLHRAVKLAEQGGTFPDSWNKLHEFGVPDFIVERLHDMATKHQTDPFSTILIWLITLARGPAGTSLTDVQKSLILNIAIPDRETRALRRECQQIFGSIPASDWRLEQKQQHELRI